METAKFLFLGAIGPVQPFIASARRVQDLNVGSRILSVLATTGIQAAKNTLGSDCQLLFPVPFETGEFPTSVPHRFAFICPGDPNVVEQIATSIETAMHAVWNQEFVDPVFAWLQQIPSLKTGWQTVFNRQRDDWLEFYWVAVSYSENARHGSSFSAAQAALAQRKLARHYRASIEAGAHCTLTGEQSALFQRPQDWEPVRARLRDTGERPRFIRKHENLGTVAIIKRLIEHVLKELSTKRTVIQEAFFQAIQVSHSAYQITSGILDDQDPEGYGLSDEISYHAVLHMDGDNMGITLSNLSTIEAHQTLSRALTDFAREVRTIVEQKHQGRLIYSGGDDVLALLPVWQALPCADELRTTFTNILQIKANINAATASAGIAIMPFTYPLSLALEVARNAEEQAKNNFHRNAVVIVAQQGMIRLTGAKWDVSFSVRSEPQTESIATIMDQLIYLFSTENPKDIVSLKDHVQKGSNTTLIERPEITSMLSGSIGFDVQQVYRLMSDLPFEARAAELRRIVRRHISNDLPADTQAELEDKLTAIGETWGWDMLANWLIMARFLAEKGAEA